MQTVMKTFSDQIREAINNSGFTPYVLAKNAKISESVLSRFLNGGSGLTLKTLDALAEVLGWELDSQVHQTSLPKKPGRQATKGKKVNTEVAKGTGRSRKGVKDLYQDETERYARSAHDDHFSSHRGVWEIGSDDRLCIYNNHPYRDPEQRPRETAILLIKLKAMGIEKLAYAEYGKPAGTGQYTYAMMIAASPSQMSAVTRAYREAVEEALPTGKRLDASGDMQKALREMAQP